MEDERGTNRRPGINSFFWSEKTLPLAPTDLGVTCDIDCPRLGALQCLMCAANPLLAISDCNRELHTTYNKWRLFAVRRHLVLVRS